MASKTLMRPKPIAREPAKRHEEHQHDESISHTGERPSLSDLDDEVNQECAQHHQGNETKKDGDPQASIPVTLLSARVLDSTS
jgi:hypothetical protein